MSESIPPHGTSPSPGTDDQCRPSGDLTWTDASFSLMRGGILALVITITVGCIGVLYRFPGLGQTLSKSGVQFTVFRPLHTSLAMAWIFLGGVAIVHRFLHDHAGPMTPGDQLRFRLQKWIWILTGIGAVVTISMGITSGREYLGFHPLFAIPIVLGWLLFAWNFFRATARRFLAQPVYVTMWSVGVLFFLYTFTEMYAYQIPEIFNHPLADIRLQWKGTGTLVGSFNLFVYGTLIFVGERVSGNKTYAHSRMAYLLFGVGLLNSFTNFAHHIYHVPGSTLVKQISYVVSMIEIVILLRVVFDISKMVSKRTAADTFIATRCFLTATKWWTAAMVGSAILLSVPKLNTLVHGTTAVTGHAMGTEIGIDTMALLAALTWLIEDRRRRKPDAASIRRDQVTRRWAIALNLSVASLIIWLHIAGIAEGVARYVGNPTSDAIKTMNPHLFATAGFATAICFIAVLLRVRRELCGPGHPCLTGNAPPDA
jgi:nitric oxide reductase subunit B